jgi:predicted transposase/invertase (TIGR01784 family)
VQLYLLLEHQTSVDPLMPLRLLCYIVEVLRQRAETHGLPLPPVIPFVLHQGPDRWTPSTQFLDLFELPQDLEALLRPFLPDFQHALLDLTLFDPAKEEDQPQIKVILQLLKAAREKRLIEFFQWLSGGEVEVTLLLREGFFRRCLLYAVHIDINLDVENISRSLSASPTLQHEAMSLAQKLRQEGRLEGRQEGRADGLAHGEWAGKIQMLEKFLGVTATSSSVLTSLEIAALEARYAELEQQYNLRFKK